MPTWFIPHGGGPCFFMDWKPADAWHKMADFLKSAASTLPQRPKAIVLVSAHWLESSFTVTSGHNPELIFDYYGFPQHTYELKYAAPGKPELAARITQLLGQAQLSSRENLTRGFDHGMFIPMMLMFPDGEIPVVQLSLTKSLDPEEHLQAGKALESLRDEGVLIVGSGMSFHNMRGYGDPRFGPVSDEFDGWLTHAVEMPSEMRHQALVELGAGTFRTPMPSSPCRRTLAAFDGSRGRGGRRHGAAGIFRPGDGNDPFCLQFRIGVEGNHAFTVLSPP